MHTTDQHICAELYVRRSNSGSILMFVCWRLSVIALDVIIVRARFSVTATRAPGFCVTLAGTCCTLQPTLTTWFLMI